MNFSIIIPYKENHPDRRKAILVILDHYSYYMKHYNYEIIVTEQGSVPTLDNIEYQIRYFFLENSGDFNKSWGMNYGANQAKSNNFVFCDCDAIIAIEDLIASVGYLSEYEVVNPMGTLFDMPPGSVKPTIEGSTCDRKNLNFASTISIFRKDTFFRLNGWEEGFTVWGGEDDVMSIVVKKFTKNICLDYNVFHVFHSNLRENSLHNKLLMHKLNNLNKNILQDINRDISIGDPKKYSLNKLVYQIVIGKTNKHLDDCIQNVKDYAQKHGYDYECDTEKSSHHADKDARLASEWMRLEKLASRPYVLYVDWDVKILKDFELKEEIITIKTIDTLLYFGPKIDLAKRLLYKSIELYGDKNINCFGHYIFKDYIDKDYLKYCLPDNFFKHLVWHCSGKSFL